MSYTLEQLRDYDRSDTDAMLDWAADEIERLLVENTALNAQFRNISIAPYLDRMREQAETIERLQSALLASEERAASAVREMHLYRDYATRKDAE